MLRRKPRTDAVTPALRDFILDRDKVCVLARIDPDHMCRDQWGTPHNPADRSKLTLEHVKTELRMGVRAPSDRWHLIALCAGANVGVPSKVERQAFRAYLAKVNEENAA